MNIRKYLHKCLIAAAAAGVIVGVNIPTAAAEEAAGAIVGLVTNSSKLPLAHATVTARRGDAGGTRATISGRDGVYSFADLPPGLWSISSQVEGFPEVAEPAITVAPSKATRHDIVMNTPAPTPPTPATPSTPSLASFAAAIKEAAHKATVPASG